MNVDVAGGKYTVVLPEKPDDRLHALRHGQPWRDCIGDNLIYYLAYELAETRAELTRVTHQLGEALQLSKNPETGVVE